jgi:hypothetical protein
LTEEMEKKDHSRILVRIGDFQVELEGTHENVKSLMEKPLFEFLKKLQDVAGEIPTSGAEVEAEETVPTEFPPPLGKPASLGDALTKLMIEKGWGKKPRTLAEIVTALETSGIYYKKAAIATTLVTLMKQGKLRRLGTRGSYNYVAA